MPHDNIPKHTRNRHEAALILTVWQAQRSFKNHHAQQPAIRLQPAATATEKPAKLVPSKFVRPEAAGTGNNLLGVSKIVASVKTFIRSIPTTTAKAPTAPAKRGRGSLKLSELKEAFPITVELHFSFGARPYTSTISRPRMALFRTPWLPCGGLDRLSNHVRPQPTDCSQLFDTG